MELNMVKFFEKSWLWSIFKKIDFRKIEYEYLDFGQNFWKIWIWVKIFKNLDFGQNFLKILLLVTIFEQFRFWSKFAKNLNWVEISQ